MAEKITGIVFDVATGQTIERELSQAEIADVQLAKQEAEQRKLAELAKKDARESALAKLAALGLTEEEIAAL